MHPHFDIRSFEDNMPVVLPEMPPFRHEFYAIAIKASGDGKVISGHYTDFPDGATIFFNSPFQILSWDIIPNWKGYYVMFSPEFLIQSRYFTTLLEDFPFLKIDTAIPFEIAAADMGSILKIYEDIWREYHGNSPDKFQLIEAYVLLLLQFVKRYFRQQIDPKQADAALRSANLKLFTRYQHLIQRSFYPEAVLETFANPHSTSYYAEKLNVHPNHLNAIVKSLSGQTALQHIHAHLFHLAKSHLAQTQLSVKEIAYSLRFESPNSFSTFFKKQSGTTPLGYRKQHQL